MLEGRVFETIEDIPADEWDACFPGALEGYAYHLAVERAGLKGFRYFYVAVYDQTQLVGVAPAFLTKYDLETTLDLPGLRRLIQAMKKPCPGFLRVCLAALGSPCSEVAMLGVRDPQRHYGIIDCLIRTFEQAALAHGGALLAIKDLANGDDETWCSCLQDLGYGLIPGLPSARLAIDFDTVDTYLSRLSYSFRRNMRRKLKPNDAIRFERVRSLAGLEDQIMPLYYSTLSRADMALEELTFAYFENVLTLMPDKAFCGLYYRGDTLIAANFLLQDDQSLIDKYFLMTPEGRQYNLYFVSWFDNIRLCLEQGLSVFQTGQAAYDNKVRLGAHLHDTHMAFKHRNPIVSMAFRWLAPFFAGDAAPVGESAHD